MNLNYGNYIDDIEKFFAEYSNETFVILNETNDYDEFYKLLSDFSINTAIPTAGLVINTTRILKKAGINPIEHITKIPAYFMYEHDVESLNISNVKVIGEGVFYDCNKLTDLNYAGTKNDWDKIVKDPQWLKYSSVKVVHCSDGDIKV